MTETRGLDPRDSSNAGDAAPAAAAASPVSAYRRSLELYRPDRLLEIRRALGLDDAHVSPTAQAAHIAEKLGEPRFAARVFQQLDHATRLALSLFALAESTSFSLAGLNHALDCLGVDHDRAVSRLFDLGLVTGESIVDLGSLDPFGLSGGEGTDIQLRLHPGLLSLARTVLPEGQLPAHAGAVRQVREADGLEPVLRLAAVWQRVDEAPLRRTQQGTLYKRDRDRLEDDPVLAGPISDALEPLPDMAALWLALAQSVGLVRDDPESDRLVGASPGFWRENAIHLPQMIATRWLALRSWHEQGGIQREGSTVELASPYVRTAVLLWLATVEPDTWVPLDEFDAFLRERNPAWDRAGFLAAPTPAETSRSQPGRSRREGRKAPSLPDSAVLQALLLGPAYQLGLVRVAEAAEGDGRLVQLAPLGRYILALGPPPPPRPAFEHFLYVQPNFEIIAYRQGLTPTLIGQFSRFCRWSQVGAALELRLTPESVYRGLEGGMSPREMLDQLARHSQRALPAGVAEALRTWAGRRERVTYYASVTLVEFASHGELEHALAQWPEGDGGPPVVVADRLLLVEDDSTIPFHRFRLAGSRDYRRAPESCLEVEQDGVTLALDLGRSDLLVDAELARFADELPLQPARGTPGNPRRRFQITPASLARGAENGLTQGFLSSWYERRTGAPMPPAVRLLLRAAQPGVAPLTTSRPLVLHAPNAELLDGLLQHPETAAHLGDRLGPTSVVVPDESVDELRTALGRFGLALAAPDRGTLEAPSGSTGPGALRQGRRS